VQLEYTKHKANMNTAYTYSVFWEFIRTYVEGLRSGQLIHGEISSLADARLNFIDPGP
jgi:hypothetical protein